MSLKVALERIREAQNSNALSLDLSNLGLLEIPSEVSKLTQLTGLSLSGNKLTEIKGLDKLIKLTSLNVNLNRLIDINGLKKLTQLTTLQLGSNQLTEIQSIEKLTRLTYLNLGHNKLTEIKNLAKLTRLNQLYLYVNKLTEISALKELNQLISLDLGNNLLTNIEAIECLTQLQGLNVSSNQLINLKGLEKLTKLRSLRIQRNKITELPEYLLNLNLNISTKHTSTQKNIYVAGNPFSIPPYEVIQKGNEAIKEYFLQRKKGEELLHEAKLILLGDGRSGKTSLANRLLGKELPTQADRTQGVDIIIGEYSFPIANNKTFRLNIWDFAGQDKYKTLHQLFYTESSLYVMVAESGNMTTDFNDWLQTAEIFGEESPLILVLNEFKSGIGMGSFDVNYWKKQFPQLLKEVFTSNLGTKDNFQTVEEHIQLLAQTLPHTKHPFPSNWAAIRRALNERRDENYISLKEYLQVCKGNNLPERDSALILSSVLHKIGGCLHYQQSELLKQIVILKNEWATDAVYKILDDEIVANEKCGFFDQTDLQRIWDAEEHRDMRPQLLELMQQFKLAYQLPGKQEYVTPPLLPPARPSHFSWPALDSLELYIEYEFLPKALLTQFIVSRHADIAEGRTLVWRHGVVLQWKEAALAEVSKTKLQGKDAIYIRTQGKNRKGMMTVILKTFRELHAEYKGIKYEEKVPCTCEGCKSGKNKQHYFDFAHLQLRLEKGRHEVECNRSLDSLNVLELLENTFIFEKMQKGIPLLLKEDVARIGSSETRILKLFLASSYELKSEREKIEIALARKNKSLRKKGFIVELSIWEDAKFIGTSFRSQDNYNLEVEQCDLFAMLFHSKVGRYSFEEFNRAKSLFDKNGMPRVCIFQKDTDLPKGQSRSDADSRFDFLKRLRELEHFPILFKNEDVLVNELEGAIDKLLEEDEFVGQLRFE